jgi:hypothetical protein
MVYIIRSITMEEQKAGELRDGWMESVLLFRWSAWGFQVFRDIKHTHRLTQPSASN